MAEQLTEMEEGVVVNALLLLCENSPRGGSLQKTALRIAQKLGVGLRFKIHLLGLGDILPKDERKES